jgi:membrane protease YdiL (CAAX protease family)
MLAMKYRPFWLTFVLYLAYLGSALGLVCCLPRTKSRGNPTACGFFSSAHLAVLYYSWVPSEYWHQLADLPMTMSLALLTIGSMLLMWRLAGRPGDVRVFRGMRWPVVLFAELAAGIAFVWGFHYHRGTAHALGLDHWSLPLLTVTLVSVVVHVAAAAALEELVFRGYIYEAFACKSLHPALIILAQAGLFVVIHVPKELRLHASTLRIVPDLGLMALFGIVLGLLRWRYRSLSAPWLVHFAYNVGYYYVSSASALALMQAVQRL